MALSGIAVSPTSACGACEERRGLEAFEEGRYVKAFSLLVPCEDVDNTSANTFKVLAYLYSYESISGLNSERERAVKGWSLHEKAALTGHEDAIVSLAVMFGLGSKTIGFGPEKDIQACLNHITADRSSMIREGYYSPAEVERCISRPPSEFAGEGTKSRD